jgi:hypothetical protein
VVIGGIGSPDQAVRLNEPTLVALHWSLSFFIRINMITDCRLTYRETGENFTLITYPFQQSENSYRIRLHSVKFRTWRCSSVNFLAAPPWPFVRDLAHCPDRSIRDPDHEAAYVLRVPISPRHGRGTDDLSTMPIEVVPWSEPGAVGWPGERVDFLRRTTSESQHVIKSVINGKKRSKFG